MTADELIGLLGLAPHPEGGHYRETFRDAENSNRRAHSTAIYFLLKAGERSRWHRIDAAEIWHWYAGAPLSLSIRHKGETREMVLGNDVVKGEAPQIVVPTNAWQSAQSLGEFTLCGCTVAPGFEFAHFELAPDGVLPE